MENRKDEKIREPAKDVQTPNDEHYEKAGQRQ